MNSTIYVWLNIVSAVAVFIHCVCRLSIRQWKLKQPELWAHAILCGGAISVLWRSLLHQNPSLSEVVMNCGLAVFFLSQGWRLWLIKKPKI